MRSVVPHAQFVIAGIVMRAGEVKCAFAAQGDVVACLCSGDNSVLGVSRELCDGDNGDSEGGCGCSG